MDMLNITEFKDYITEKRPKEIIYNDENNGDYMQGTERRCYSITQPLHMCLNFDSIIVDAHPHSLMVCLKGKAGMMTFRNVQKIGVDYSVIGNVVTLYCNADEKTKAYTLIIR